jgi:transcription elongation factor SPT5
MSKSGNIFSSDDDSSSSDEEGGSSNARNDVGSGDSDQGLSEPRNHRKRPRDEQSSSSSSKKKSRDALDSSSSSPSRKKKKKKKRDVASRFFEEDAEDDDDEGGAFEDKDAEDDETEEQRRRRENAQMAIDRRRSRQKNNLQTMSAAEIARNFKERRRIEKERERVFKRLSKESMIMHRKVHLPTVHDPTLFAVKCKPSMERQLVCQILNKAFFFMKDPRKPNLQILSASMTRTKGYVFIEARNKQHVVMAVRGMSGIYPSKISKVPIKEMTDTMLVAQASQSVVKAGQWVRVKRSAFRGDLAKIVEVSQEEKRAIVQLVPRLDLVTLEPIINEATGKRMKQKKPPQVFFDPDEVRTYVASASKDMRLKNPERRQFEHMQKRPNLVFWQGGYYTSTGWRVLRFDLKALDVNVVPTLEEARVFAGRKLGLANDQTDMGDMDVDDDGINEDGIGMMMGGGGIRSVGAGDDASSALASGVIGGGGGKGGIGASAGKSRILAGDHVRVVKGELAGLEGKVRSVDLANNNCLIVPTNLDGQSGGGDEYEFDMDTIIKHFAIGAHVKVTSGHYHGETGTVVKVELSQEAGGKDEAIVILDNSVGGGDGGGNNNEIKVFTESLRETDEVAQRLDRLEGYKLYDLVAMKDQLRGCVVQIGREKLTVLLQGGAVETCVPADLMFGNRNQESKRSIALDARKQAVSVNDSIVVREGKFKGFRGSVKHVSRNFLFVKCAQQVELAGIICITSNQCTLQGMRSNRDLAGLSMGKIDSSAAGNMAMRNPNRGRRARVDHKHALHKATVCVIKGKWKGHVGMVKRHTDTHVEVEIHARHKTVQMEIEWVKKVGNSEGRISAMGGGSTASGAFGASAGRMYSSADLAPAQFAGAATPGANDYDPSQIGGATPMDGGATPGGAWDADAFATPAGGHDDDVWADNGGQGGGSMGDSSMYGAGMAPSSMMPPQGGVPDSGLGGNASSIGAHHNAGDSSAWGGHGDGRTPGGAPSSFVGGPGPGGVTPAGGFSAESMPSSSLPPPPAAPQAPAGSGFAGQDAAVPASASGGAASALIDNWVHERVCVRVRKEGPNFGCVGMVTQVMAGRMCRIDVLEPPSKRGVIDVREAHLEPEVPAKGDRVIVVGNEADPDMWGKQGMLNIWTRAMLW